MTTPNLMRILKDAYEKGTKLCYFQDMGNEFYIYRKDDEDNPIYKGFTFDVIEQLMDHFNVKDKG